jgi:hypothetical protein
VLDVRGDAYVLNGLLAQLHIPETLQGSRSWMPARRPGTGLPAIMA